MTYYGYNRQTKKYTGEITGQLSPLEPGVYLQPANSTSVKPPVFDSKKKVATWDGAKWALSDLPTQTEIDWGNIRQTRNYLLGITDYTQILDADLSSECVIEFAAYRQKLRDITKAGADPSKVEWPTFPMIQKKVL